MAWAHAPKLTVYVPEGGKGMATPVPTGFAASGMAMVFRGGFRKMLEIRPPPPPPALELLAASARAVCARASVSCASCAAMALASRCFVSSSAILADSAVSVDGVDSTVDSTTSTVSVAMSPDNAEASTSSASEGASGIRAGGGELDELRLPEPWNEGGY